jgi:hypothetical protein
VHLVDQHAIVDQREEDGARSIASTTRAHSSFFSSVLKDEHAQPGPEEVLDPEKVARLVAISKITEDGARSYLAHAGGAVRRAAGCGTRLLIAKEAMSVHGIGTASHSCGAAASLLAITALQKRTITLGGPLTQTGMRLRQESDRSVSDD